MIFRIIEKIFFGTALLNVAFQSQLFDCGFLLVSFEELELVTMGAFLIDLKFMCEAWINFLKLSVLLSVQ